MVNKTLHIKNALLQFIAVAVFMLICSVAIAQTKFTTSVSEKQIALNDYIEVQYTIENAKSVDKFSFAPFRNFRIIQGPVQSSGMTITNGVMSQYKGMSFVLQPVSAGRLLIPGASAVIDGKPQRSNAVVIEVVPSSNRAAPSSPFTPSPSAPPASAPVTEEYVLQPGDNIIDKIKNNLMVVAQVNKNTCFAGEPIVATYKLYSRLRSESRVVKRPSLNGFSVFDMIEPEDNNPFVETLNGKSYNVHIIRKTQLFPLQPGTFTLDPVELENKVRFVKSVRARVGERGSIQQLLDEFLNDEGADDVEEHTFTLASKPITVTVKPLPQERKPMLFNGAVGQFNISSAIANKEIAAGDAIEYKVQINGQGNFTVLNAPSLTLPDGIDMYDPKITEDVDKAIYPLKGKKTFEYVLVARDTGKLLIPPTRFAYFDPVAAQYKTVSSDSFYVQVTPALRKDGVMEEKGTETSSQPVWQSPIFIAVLLALAVVFVAVLGLYQWRKNAKEDKRKSLRAGKTVEKVPEQPALVPDPLMHAKHALQSGESQRFYRELNKAAWKAVADKLQLPATSQNKPTAISQLRYKGVNSEVINNFESLLNECELALYTPVHDPADMQHMMRKAEQVIEKINLS